MIEELDDSDWQEAFKYASNPDPERPSLLKTDFDPVRLKANPFTREDVVEIYAMQVGENDGPAWIMGGRLKDKRYFFLTASCDYTGWG